MRRAAQSVRPDPTSWVAAGVALFVPGPLPITTSLVCHCAEEGLDPMVASLPQGAAVDRDGGGAPRRVGLHRGDAQRPRRPSRGMRVPVRGAWRWLRHDRVAPGGGGSVWSRAMTVRCSGVSLAGLVGRACPPGPLAGLLAPGIRSSRVLANRPQVRLAPRGLHRPQRTRRPPCARHLADVSDDPSVVPVGGRPPGHVFGVSSLVDVARTPLVFLPRLHLVHHDVGCPIVDRKAVDRS